MNGKGPQTSMSQNVVVACFYLTRASVLSISVLGSIIVVLMSCKINFHLLYVVRSALQNAMCLS